MRRGGTCGAYDDGARIVKVRTSAIEDLLPAGVDHGVQVHTAVACRLDHHDAEGSRELDHVENRGFDFDRHEVVAKQIRLRFQQQHVAKLHDADRIQYRLRSAVPAVCPMLADTADGGQRGRDAYAAERIIHRRDFSQHAAAMGKI